MKNSGQERKDTTTAVLNNELGNHSIDLTGVSGHSFFEAFL